MSFFLGLTGLALDRAFVNSQLAGQSERLFIRVFNLLSLAELDDITLSLPATAAAAAAAAIAPARA